MHTDHDIADTARRDQEPIHNWRDIFLAILPFLTILVIDVVPKILVEAGLMTWDSPNMKALTSGLSSLAVITFVIISSLAWRQKWPDWAASWYLFYVVVPIGLIGWVLNLFINKNSAIMLNLQSIFLYQIIPLVVALLLYVLIRQHRIRVLLAAWPVLYLLWLPNMEFVADSIEVIIKILSTVLICLVIALFMRGRDWRLGFYATLAANLVVGFMFSFAGTYHGGTLPFTAPGPSLVEVLRSLIPQYLATSAILVGPFFAWIFRHDGMAQGKVARIGYHLASGGLLLIIIANLAGLMIGMDRTFRQSVFLTNRVLGSEIILGIIIYIIGLFMLYRGAQFASGVHAWFVRLLLVVLPLAIPIALILPLFSWTVSVSDLYGIPQLWRLPHDLVYLLGVVWLLLSAWLITRNFEYPISEAPSAKTSEAALSG